MYKWVEKITSEFPQKEWGQQVARYLEKQPHEKWDSLLKVFFSHASNIKNVNLPELARSISSNLERSCNFLDTINFAFELLTHTEKPESQDLAASITREKILDAALKVFSSRGYHDATVEEIAREAEVGKGTVYRYFRSKESLYRQMIDAKLEDLNSQIQNIITTEEDVLEIIWQCVTVYMQFFEENRGLYRLILSEEIESVGSKYVKRALRNLYPLKRKLLEAAKKGRFKPLNFETAFYGFMGFLHGVVQKWLDHDCNYSLLNEVPTVSEILLYGVVKRSEEFNYKKPEKEELDGQRSNQTKGNRPYC